jgi:putative ABC transport system permease protein
MRLDQLVLRNIVQHRVGASLTALNVALGALLVGVVLLLRAATADTFIKPSRGFSLVVGAPGSGLQLVLDSVFFMGQSPGLLDYEAFEEVRRHPSTELAVPYAVGDAFRGFRVVGTTDAFFDARFPYPSAAPGQNKLAVGRAFRFDAEALKGALRALAAVNTNQPPADGVLAQTTPATNGGAPAVAEAVLGAEVAASLDIRVGDRIEPTHGVEGGLPHTKPQLWDVVGILRATETPLDRLVLINLDSFFRIDDHMGGIVPETGNPAISSVVLFPKPGVHKAILLSHLNKRTQLQVADVDSEVRNLLRIVGNVDRVFFVIAVAVVLVGAASVAVAIYNTLNARRRELAILRVLGARRATVFGMILAEAAVLSALGGGVGLLAGHGVVSLTADLVERSSGVRPAAGVFLMEELLAYVLVVAAGACGGLLPAFKAYRTDAASHLAPLT